jgi:CheY-specific phosphatase CheX
MFTQLFGSFLLNKKLVTIEQLMDALNYQSSVRLKLGVLAVNAGYMTSDDINKVHEVQSRVDKKFGEIAIEMGFLDEEKVNKLLSSQKTGYLLLGQALVDKNYMTLKQFEEAINIYKKEHSLTNEQLQSIDNGDFTEVVNEFYRFDNLPGGEIYKDYFSLLLRNIIRFIDGSFIPKDKKSISSYKYEWMVSQNIYGNIGLGTYICGDEKAFISFASKFAQENFNQNDEYVQASVGEFLNQINGLFLVNMSNSNIELELTPQAVKNHGAINDLSEAFCITIEFPFGEIDFIISKTI